MTDTMQEQPVETAPKAAKRPKRTAAEVKAAKVAKAQKDYDAVVAKGTTVVKRSEDLRVKFDAAKAKADEHAEDVRVAAAVLEWEKGRPVKGETDLTGDVEDPFTVVDDETVTEDVEVTDEVSFDDEDI